MQELRTLSEALNAAGRGELSQMCDILAQRFCAVEQRALGQHENARGLELDPENATGCAAAAWGPGMPWAGLRFS